MKFKFSVLLVFFCLIFIPVCGEENIDYFTRGLNSYYGGNIDKALSDFEEVLKKSPDNHEALFYKAQILSKKGETSRGVEVLKKAISLKPARVFYLYKLAEFYSILKDNENLLKLWQDIKNLKPLDPGPYYAMADIYESQGKLSLAIAELESVFPVETQVSAKIFYRLGKLYFKINNPDKALYYLNKSLALEPDNMEIALFLGNLYYKQGNLGMASTYYIKLINADPYRVDIHRRLAYIFYRQGDLNNSAIHFGKVAKLEPEKFENHYNLGCIYYYTANYEGAIKEFALALEKDPSNYLCHYNLGCIYFKAGNYDNALKKFSQVVELKPDDNVYLYALGAIYYVRKEYEKAFEAFGRIKYKDSFSSDGYIKEGITYRDKGLVDIPIRDFIIPEEDREFLKN